MGNYTLTTAQFDRIIAALSFLQDMDETNGFTDEAKLTRELVDDLHAQAGLKP